MSADGQKSTVIEQKKLFRHLAKTTLHQLPQQRRLAAANAVVEMLLPRLSAYPLILSFASYKEEIDLVVLNGLLFSKNQLCLPSLSGGVFHILSSKSLFSREFSLNSELHSEILLESVDCILVPALIFDKDRYRLGRGGGFYDRLLKRRASKTLCLGVGFKEQLSKQLLPREEHDQPVDELILI